MVKKIKKALAHKALLYLAYIGIAWGILLVAVAISLYFTLKKPVLSKAQCTITQYMHQDTIPMLCHFTLYNPNFFSIKFDSVSYELFIIKEINGSGKIGRGYLLKAQDSTRLSIPLDFFFSPAVQKAAKAGQDHATFDFKFRFYTHIGSKVLAIPYTLTKRLSIYKKLKIKPELISLKDFKLSNTNINATIHLENPNAMRYHSTLLQYGFYVDSKLLASGATSKEYILAKEGKCTVHLPVQIQNGPVLSEMFDYKVAGGNKPFLLKLHIRLSTETNKPPYYFDLDIEEKGHMKDLKTSGDKKTGKIKIQL